MTKANVFQQTSRIGFPVGLGGAPPPTVLLSAKPVTPGFPGVSGFVSTVQKGWPKNPEVGTAETGEYRAEESILA